jgi:hypothetical protein
MRKARSFPLALALALVLGTGAATAADDKVYVADGVKIAAFDGQLKGKGSRDYLLPARKSQKLAVTVTSRSGLIHFKVIPPAGGHALYDSARHGDTVTGLALPGNGIYTIRVFMGAEGGTAGKHYAIRMSLS